MALVAIIGAVVALVTAYFCLGILVRFLWEWWILVVSTPLFAVVGFQSGWAGAAIAFFAWLYTIKANNDWHSKPVYFSVAEWIDRRFNFSD